MLNELNDNDTAPYICTHLHIYTQTLANKLTHMIKRVHVCIILIGTTHFYLSKRDGDTIARD